MRLLCLPVLVLSGFLVPSLSAQGIADPGVVIEPPSITDMSVPGALPPVPRYRENGTPYDRDQSLTPFNIELDRDVPSSGSMVTSAEYEPIHGVVYWYNSGAWNTVVRDLVVALTQPGYDEIAYVVVTSTAQRNHATSVFTSAGADMSKVEFIIQPGETIWMRDYGPHFMWQNDTLAIADSHYYPTRPLDNFAPTLLGDNHFSVPTYDMGLYFSGGNFMPGPERSAFMSALILGDNPSSQGFSTNLIGEIFSQYLGIDTLHIMPQLPWSVDGTGHIDMWMYVVDEDDVIVSEFKPGSHATAIQVTNNAVSYLQGLGFTVHRTPAWNATHPGTGYMTHWTYTNAFRVNNRIFTIKYASGVPSYQDEDDAAYAAWVAAAGPGVEIVPINCYDIIWAAGAIHCIVKQVPRCVDLTPNVHVRSPAGGEFLASSTTHTIEWEATDTDNAPADSIDLYYSLNDGASWEYIDTTTDTGAYDWAVPVAWTTAARVKVVATADDSDVGEAVSEAAFQISPTVQHVYDFATDAGVDRFGWGRQTPNWTTYVRGHRHPVTSEIDALQSGAYGKMAYSDATGSDFDSNRYRSPSVQEHYECTHTFEFTIAEDPADILDLAVLWEGYADQCTQVELYVWDYVETEWGDGNSLYDWNRYMDSWAGNVDGTLEGHVRTDLDRYIDTDGEVTFLVYAERPRDETFHDYMAVTTTTLPPLCAGDLNCDGVVDFDDIDPFVAALGCGYGVDACWAADCPWMNGDCNGDFKVDFDDIDAFVGQIGANCP